MSTPVALRTGRDVNREARSASREGGSMSKGLLRRAVVFMAVVATAASAAGAASAATYVVMYKGTSVPAGAEAKIQKSGGRVVVAYDAIGVVVAQSLYDTFESAMEQDSRVQGVAKSDKPVAQVNPDVGE